jgi:LytTr DNA-binding domain
MKNWINKPFPQIETIRQKLLVSSLFAIFIFVFLIVFQPFGLSEIKIHKPLYIGGFFAVTFIVMFSNYLIIPLLLKKIFVPENWTIKKNIYFILWQIIIISIFNWLYNSTFGKNITEQYDLISFLLITIAVGFTPTILYSLIVEKLLSKKHTIIAEELTTQFHTPVKTEIEQLKIISENKKETIILSLKDFICVSSEGNYANVFFYENDKITKKLIRSSLARINEQLIIFDTIKRCHRSFIVNLQNIENVSGNARNYNFHIKKLDFAIPVSRNFPKTYIENIKNVFSYQN